MEGRISLQTRTDRKSEQGMAMLVTVLILLLMGTVAAASIQFSGEEWAAGGRSRSALRSLHAADAGIQLAGKRLNQTPANLTPFDVTLPNNVNIQSRRKTDTAPQPLKSVGFGPPPEGYSLSVSTSYARRFFLVDVTAQAPGGSQKEIQAKFAKLTAL